MNITGRSLCTFSTNAPAQAPPAFLVFSLTRLNIGEIMFSRISWTRMEGWGDFPGLRELEKLRWTLYLMAVLLSLLVSVHVLALQA